MTSVTPQTAHIDEKLVEVPFQAGDLYHKMPLDKCPVGEVVDLKEDLSQNNGNFEIPAAWITFAP